MSLRRSFPGSTTSARPAPCRRAIDSLIDQHIRVTHTATTTDIAGNPVNSRRERPHWGWWVAFGVLVVGLSSIAAESAIHFDDTPIDGPFQLFNALRRLSAGQRFGGTFQFFHGPGIPYLHLLP